MLADAPVTTLLPVVDLDRARHFYQQSLGLRPVGARADGKFIYACAGGALLALFPRHEGTRAEHTALSFQVPDVEAAVQALEAAGVVFEDYDLPGLRTEGHLCVLGAERAAWFKDSEGNILCVHQDLA
ncbi:VOC family protein [Niveibacterium sp.]|uniref:VOC family protein n=1 Tax=Niveibacterium sp. TaxID=2017444 RepID=UPI0035B4487B